MHKCAQNVHYIKFCVRKYAQKCKEYALNMQILVNLWTQYAKLYKNMQEKMQKYARQYAFIYLK